MAFTKQTPQAVRDFLANYQIAFPENWTLDRVAEECHRKRMAGHLQNPYPCMRAVVQWGMQKLATCHEFSDEHWGWIAAPDKYDAENGYSRLTAILHPAAAAATASWKTTATERESLLEKIDDVTTWLLQTLHESMRLDVDLAQVVGWNPEMRPLRVHSRKLLDMEMQAGRQRARDAKRQGATPMQCFAAAMPTPDGYREPRLSDFLQALRSALRQTPGAPPITGMSAIDDALDELDSASVEIMAERFGIVRKNQSVLTAIQPGGDFGAYPNRNDSLRRAIILEFPGAIYDRHTEPPKTTPASVIEAACIAWFGNAPALKDINAMIKPVRAGLEQEMRREIAYRKRHDERMAKYKSEGLSEDEINQREMQRFLDEDDPELSDIERPTLRKLRIAREGRKSSGK